MRVANKEEFNDKFWGLKSEWLLKFFMYFVLLDITIFPYFKYFVIPYSLPFVVFLSLITGCTSKKDYYYYLFIVIVVGVGVSLLASAIITPYNQYLVDNLKRACQLLTTFAYFFSIKWISSKVNINYRIPLYLYILIVGILAHLFVMEPIETLEMMRGFYGRLVTEQEVVLTHYRFAYLFSDPNTATYFFLMALSPVLIALQDRPFWFAILISLGMMIVFIGQSRGAIIIFPAILFFSYFHKAGELSVSHVLPKIAPFCLVITLGFILFLLYFYINSNNIVLEKAYSRLFSGDGSYANGGHRFEIWMQGINYYLPLPFGRGYSLCMNDELYFPHSDFFGILYRYGFISLFALIYFLFHKFSSSFSLFLPGLMAFSINSLVDEQKVFALFLMLLAFGLNDQNRKNSVRS